MYNIVKINVANAAKYVVGGAGSVIGMSVRAAEKGVSLGYSAVAVFSKGAYVAGEYLVNSWKLTHDTSGLSATKTNVANKFASSVEKSVTFLSVDSAIKSHYASVISNKTGIDKGIISTFAPVAAHLVCEVSGKLYLDMALVSYSGYVNAKGGDNVSYVDNFYNVVFPTIVTFAASKVTNAYPLVHLYFFAIAPDVAVKMQDDNYDTSKSYDVAKNVLNNALNPETVAMISYKMVSIATSQSSLYVKVAAGAGAGLLGAFAGYLAHEYVEASYDQETYTPCLPSMEFLGLCGQDDDLAHV